MKNACVSTLTDKAWINPRYVIAKLSIVDDIVKPQIIPLIVGSASGDRFPCKSGHTWKSSVRKWTLLNCCSSAIRVSCWLRYSKICLQFKHMEKLNFGSNFGGKSEHKHKNKWTIQDLHFASVLQCLAISRMAFHDIIQQISGCTLTTFMQVIARYQGILIRSPNAYNQRSMSD